MTRKVCIAMLCFSTCSLAQEPSPTVTPSPTPSRSVRISFVPPPLEGKISLGIYDENNQLVRVLHQEAELDDFTVGADALVTKWDGKDDFGYDLWPGTYHGRGFLVAPMKIEEITTGDAVMPTEAQPIKVRLVANPLEKNERPTVQLTGGIDDEDALLKTVDGLPLLTVTRAPDLKRVLLTSDAGRKERHDVYRDGRNETPFLHYWSFQNDGVRLRQIRTALRADAEAATESAVRNTGHRTESLLVSAPWLRLSFNIHWRNPLA